MARNGDLDSPMQPYWKDRGTGGNQPGDKEGTSLMGGVPTIGGLDTPLPHTFGSVGTTPGKDLPGLQITEDVQGVGMNSGVGTGPISGPNPSTSIKR